MPPVGTTVDENGNSQLCPPWQWNRSFEKALPRILRQGARAGPTLAITVKASQAFTPSKEGTSKEHCGTQRTHDR